MQFNLARSLEILERTPAQLTNLLQGLSEDWIYNNEGEDSWSPFDIVGHLIHGDKTDWIPRMKVILSDDPNGKFEPFDRFAQFRDSQGKTLEQLLETFKLLREQNIAYINSLNLSQADFQKTGIHPDFGEVALSQLISTWVVHDLNHIGQIVRVMAKQYRKEVGPWIKYLKILRI